MFSQYFLRVNSIELTFSSTKSLKERPAFQGHRVSVLRVETPELLLSRQEVTDLAHERAHAGGVSGCPRGEEKHETTGFM